ncbi:MAG: DUF2336 domain-containing protein [Bauldia sp.]
MQKPFRSNDLADLSLSSQQNRDAALLRATTDLFLQEPSHDRDEIRRYEELASHFLPRVSQADRAYVAERLASRSDAPTAVIRLLAKDTVEIARHILIKSPVLTSLDLLTVVAATGAEHHRLIAARERLGADVERALRLMGDTETSDVIARRHETPPALAAEPAVKSAPVAPLPSPAPVPFRRSRDIAGPNPAAIDVWHFLALDRAHRLRLMADLTTRPPPRRYSGPANRLDQAFRSILGAAQVVSFARRGQRGELVTAVSEGLGVDFEIVIACIDDPTGEAFAILLKVLGLDNIQAQQVLLLATPQIGRDVNAFFRLADVYAAMETSVAEILVAAWRGDIVAGPRHVPVFAPLATRRPAGSPIDIVRDKPSVQNEQAARDGTG